MGVSRRSLVGQPLKSSTNVEQDGPIYTIGYSGRKIDDFIAILQQYQFDYLCDVRSKPHSRYFPDFSRPKLKWRLDREGIKYVFMGDTLGGIPADEALLLNGHADYTKMSQLESFQKGFKRLQSASRQRLSLVLMCSELRPESCHRSKLIGVELESKGITTLHVDENGNLINQSEVISRLTRGQALLPLVEVQDHVQTSRKTFDLNGEGTGSGL